MNAEKVYNQEGKSIGSVKLPDSLFSVKWSPDLVHQVVVSMQSNKRRSIAHAKNRQEVRGGGRKPWQQKGLGRARHGSIRSPIWRGGGVTHGPTVEKDYAKKINKKMKRRALVSILSRKLKDGEILFVDKLSYSDVKTKRIQESLNKFSNIKGFKTINYKKGKRAFICLPSKNDGILRMSRNIPAISVDEVRNINPLDILNYKYLDYFCQLTV